LILRLTNRSAGIIAFFFLLLLAPTPQVLGEEPSLGEKIQKFLAPPTPTPAPSHRRHKSITKESSSTASPTPSASPKSTSRREGTPKTKRKKSSPTPSPSALPTATDTSTPTSAPSPEVSPTETPGPEKGVATVSPNEIEGFEKYPDPVRKLLESALALTKRNLGYAYGSADPANGGMDCSGFIYFVLRENGVSDVPRDASEQYVWVRKAGNFRAVLSRDLDSFELDELKPGDLLFWTGTYQIERDPPVTHTMIYLGHEKRSGKSIMVGASDGRPYDGRPRFGVSVFDFKTTKPTSASDLGKRPAFVGYARIPGWSSPTR
jgi:cell wall-associated NlpC family hydrolase